MKLLRYIISIIGILHHVEAKALQSSNTKGTFDHMYENLYLKKAIEKSNKNDQKYDMRYVPHVEGKPIFIPFGEFETLTPPNLLKPRPNQLRYKAHASGVVPTKNYQNVVPQSHQSPKYDVEVKKYVKTSAQVAEFLKSKKETQTKYDHPVVINAVTKKTVDSDKLNYGLEGEEYTNQKKHDVEKVVTSEQGVKKEFYVPVKKVIEKDGTKYDSSYKLDSHKDSNYELKESVPDYHAGVKHEKILEENSMLPFNNHDSPAVVESITKEDNEDYDDPIVIRPFTNKHKGSTSVKKEEIKVNKKPIIQETNLKVKPDLVKDTKSPQKPVVSEYKPEIVEHKQPSDHEDYDLPVVVESFVKETAEDYDSPVVVESFVRETTEDSDDPLVIRPFSEKHSEIKKAEAVKINNPVKDVKNSKIKYDDTKLPEKKKIKYDHEFAVSEDPHFLPDGSIDPRSDGNKLQDENFQKEIEYTTIFEGNNPINTLPEDFDYYEEYDNDEEYNDDSDPAIVEALVQKTQDLNTPVKIKDVDDYDSPVVVEALLKKTTEKSDDDFDSPIISEALIKKHPVENTAEKQDAHSDKDKIYPESKVSGSYKYEAPVVVDALVKKYPVKNGKKRVKYSTKMKPKKSSTHSQYEEKTTAKNVDSLRIIDADKLTTSSNIKTSEDTNIGSVEQSNVESFSNEFFNADSLGDSNDQFDTGSGLINERSGISDDSRSLSAKSSVWPLLNSFHSHERNKFKKCTTPSGEPGNCMPIQMCPTPNLQLTLDDLLKKICAVDEVFIGICCPEFPAETLKVDWENFNNETGDDKEALETKPEGCGKIHEFGKDPQSWPWMAPLISVSTRRIFCGGVLIKEQYVLTAAHCTRKIPRNQIVVVLGPSVKDATPQEFEVIEIKRHAQYNPKTMQNDLALLKLSRKVRRPFICLPEEETFVGEEALMLGWQGSFSASKAEEKLLIISPQQCRKAAVKIVVGENIMCTEPRTEDVMCNVDSGAPLVVKRNGIYQVIGVSTWNRNDCDSSFPSIFTRISHFRRWIENHAI